MIGCSKWQQTDFFKQVRRLQLTVLSLPLRYVRSLLVFSRMNKFVGEEENGEIVNRL